MAYVYILRGTSGPYYIGSCEDVEKRLKRHNGGWAHSSKRLGLPLELVASREFGSVSEARKIEAMLKRWKNPSKALDYLCRDG